MLFPQFSYEEKRKHPSGEIVTNTTFSRFKSINRHTIS